MLALLETSAKSRVQLFVRRWTVKVRAHQQRLRVTLHVDCCVSMNAPACVQLYPIKTSIYLDLGLCFLTYYNLLCQKQVLKVTQLKFHNCGLMYALT